MRFLRWALPCHTATLVLLFKAGLTPSVVAFVGCNQRPTAILGSAMCCNGVAAATDTYPASGEMRASNSNVSSFAEMERWLNEIGVDRGSGVGVPPAARLGRFPGRGIGLEAAVELERDSTVASIPRRACLSSDPADAPAGSLRALAHSIVASMSPGSSPSSSDENATFERDVAVVTLQVFLECAAGARSAFAPWMTILRPRGELNLPALWPGTDLQALKGTLVLEDVERCLVKAEVERDAVVVAIANRRDGWTAVGKGGTVVVDETEEFVEHSWLGLEEMGERPTKAEWLHARCTVQSRAYRVESRYLLIPLVDFANHDDDVAFSVCPGDGVFTGSDEVVFVADRGYRPGQEVCTSYGADMDNAKRLFSFGFVTLQGPARSSHTEAPFPLPTEAFCDVSFSVPSTDKLCNLKEGILQELERRAGDGGSSRKRSAVFALTPCSQSVLQLVEGPVLSFLESILPALRLVAMTPEQFDREVAFGGLYNRVRSSASAPKSDPDRFVRGVRDDQVIAFRGLEAQESGQITERLERSLSPENEREALRLLEEQCSARLRAIGLTLNDIDCLKRAVDESSQAGTFVVSEPRSLLAATVRVGEAIAWAALLEACTDRMDGRVSIREGTIWGAWISELCVRSIV